MPHQTRSRSRSPKRDDEPRDAPAAAAAAAAEGETSGSSGCNTPLQQGASAAASTTSPEEYHVSTPEARPAPEGSSSPSSRGRTASRAWGARRDHREGTRVATQGESSIFSPPPYKTDRFSHPSHRDPATMDQAERRDFDQLDLNVDFTGPEDPLMLGSFSEESPPRLPPPGGRSPSLDQEPTSERKRTASASRSRRSPSSHPYAYQQPYSSTRPPYGRSSREGYHSTPGQGGSRGPPHPGYQYGGYPPQSSPRFYAAYSPYQYQADRYWDGPPGPYPYDHEDEIPPPPPSSTKKGPPQLTPSDHPHSPHGTPEKIKPRSPFRSPPASKQKYKRSPDFHASPCFGTHGSFGMDTPNAMLGPAEFSPMGPSLEELDENAPLPFSGVLGISRSNSQDSTTPVIRRRTIKEEASPLTGFMNELSPFQGLHGIARSPVVQPRYDEPSSHERAKPVTESGTRGGEPRIHSTPHGSVKKALWPRSEAPTSSSTPGRVRLEIGSTGSLSTRKSLEGINTMMHSRQMERESSTPSRHDPYARGQPLPHHRVPPPPGAYRVDMATPIKSSGYHSRAPPSGMHRHPYPGSASKYPHPPPAHHSDYPGSASKARYGPPASTIPPSTGKENKKTAASPKRSPCNCKKSKCLKLYCECFAAMEFCKDCNCTECGNSPTAGAIRDKAIKDTKAKNPNAFKPRFSAKPVPQDVSPQAGHNMGCRCKRSECLKKYCECFQAGVICGNKCKCVDCLNFAGSQALIDKRRKIKDQRGADFAMRVADEAWKQGRPSSARKPPAPAASGAAAAANSGPVSRRPPSKSPSMSHMPPPHMMHPSPRGPPPQHGGPHGPPHPGPHGHPHHPYHSMPPYMRGPPPGYPHMGMPMTPAGYPPHHGPPHRMSGESPHTMYPPRHGPPPSAHRKPDLKRPPPTSHPKQVTPVATTPRTPGVRVKFDPASSRKKRKISPGQDEAALPFFGLRYPAQPKTTALAIFSFLSNDDLYNGGLVCKSWSQLAMDDELWKFDES